jgi:hypothetical protein
MIEISQTWSKSGYVTYKLHKNNTIKLFFSMESLNEYLKKQL